MSADHVRATPSERGRCSLHCTLVSFVRLGSIEWAIFLGLWRGTPERMGSARGILRQSIVIVIQIIRSSYVVESHLSLESELRHLHVFPVRFETALPEAEGRISGGPWSFVADRKLLCSLFAFFFVPNDCFQVTTCVPIRSIQRGTQGKESAELSAVIEVAYSSNI
jgi:hypothetical protein